MFVIDFRFVPASKCFLTVMFILTMRSNVRVMSSSPLISSPPIVGDGLTQFGGIGKTSRIACPMSCGAFGIFFKISRASAGNSGI